MADETLNELRQALDDAVLTRTGRSIGDLASQHVLDDIMPYITALQPAQPADEPRALVRAFALAMERKLAAREYRGSWRNYSAGTAHLWTLAHAEMDEFRDALNNLGRLAIQGASQDALLDARQAVLDEAADVANYLMMICDVIGALPPTDERGW